MKVIEFLEKTFDPVDEYQRRSRIHCKDGYHISVQGGTEFHYCEPRKKINVYESLELGFPSSFDDLINQFAEDPNSIETVFPYVPIDIVEKLIEKHGGIDQEITVFKS